MKPRISGSEKRKNGVYTAFVNIDKIKDEKSLHIHFFSLLFI
jgi:hypothetical protein